MYFVSATALPADTTYDDDYDPNFANDPEPGVQNDYDYNEGEDEAEDIKSDAVAPEILSKSQEFLVERNGEVTLPCNTSNASKYNFYFKLHPQYYLQYTTENYIYVKT